MHDLLITDEFNKYRRKELQTIAKHIWQLMNSEKFEQAKGALDLANVIVNFPSKLSSGDDVKQKTQEMIREFQVYFMRGVIE